MMLTAILRVVNMKSVDLYVTRYYYNFVRAHMNPSRAEFPHRLQSARKVGERKR